MPETVFCYDDYFLRYGKLTGAIIGDGDRKSWNPRAPMIWDDLFY